MMLVETTATPDASLPVAEFRNHLRLGTGFADEGAEDSLLQAFLRAAIASVEAWTGKVLLARDYEWTLNSWRDERVQALPVAPVASITSVKIVDRLQWETTVDPAAYKLQQDTHRPSLVALSACLPTIPTAGEAKIAFAAGFGPDWSDVPPDLAQAVMLLAAYHYEYRHEMRASGTVMPYGVSSLVERWRAVRILGGRA